MSSMEVDESVPASAAAVAGAGEKAEEIFDLRNPSVTDRYRNAAQIADKALVGAIAKAVAGASIVEVCDFADALIATMCKQAFKATKMEKGVAFPTCLSVNECVGHFSPLKGEKDVLAAGDLVKIELGVHFDGYIATAAHTVVIGAAGAAAPEPITGPRADVMAAAHYAAEAAVRLIKPGNTNTQVTEAIAAIAAAFGVTPLQGVLMHEMKRFVIDGSHVISLRGDDPEIKVDEFAFEANQVYSIDVVLSTGDGKPRELEARTTIFKLVPENSYKPKMKAAQTVRADALKNFSFLPFTLRALEGGEGHARMGIVELVNHNVVLPYPVLFERAGAQLAHVNCTVLLLPGGTLKVTGMALAPNVASEKTLPEDIKALLATVPYAKKAKPAA